MTRALFLLAVAVVASAQNLPDVLKQGEKVFSGTCATGYCHGVRGTAAGAPRLVGRGFDQAFINNTVTRGVAGTGMPGFAASLSPPNLIAVIAYVASLNGIANPNLSAAGGAPATPEVALSPDASPGRQLFSDAVRGFARCSTCHQVKGIGIAVATPIAQIPASVPELRALATPQVTTANAGGETMPALVLSKTSRSVILYDLTTPPPVLRTLEPPSVNFAEGSMWRHASVIGSYTDAELGSILIYLRDVVKP
ncbi:MAG: c-type cytochrome [Acidobacteriota bacterium]|nr:c-type cytochrome [Acidobacteriota bacterium]